MPVEVKIKNRKFFSQLRNGVSFASNPSDVTNYLSGCVGENMLASHRIEVAVYAGGEDSGWEINGNVITRTSGSFLDEGINFNSVIDCWSASGSSSSPDIFIGRNVVFVDDTSLEFDGSPVIGFPSNNYSVLTILDKQPLEGAVFNFGLIENSEPTNYVSKIDNAVQSYYANGVVSAGAGTPVAMTVLNGNIQKSWQSGTAEITYQGRSADNFYAIYDIEHKFMMLPFYIDGWLTYLQNGGLPLLFTNQNSPKYVFELELRPAVANPNTAIKAELNDVLGSVGFYEQNFNGFNNVYYADNVVITEDSSGASSSGIIVGEKTQIDFEIETTDSFVGNEDVILYVSFLPEINEYQGVDVALNTIQENFIYDSLLIAEGAAPASATIIKDAEQSISGTTMTVSMHIEYTAAQQARIEAGDNYIVWALIGKGGLTNATDDRVALPITSGQFVKNSDVAGLMSSRALESRFYRHYRDHTNGTSRSDVKGWIQDGYLWKLDFYTNGVIGKGIKKCTFKLAAYNETTEDLFVLQKFDYDLSSGIEVTHPLNPNAVAQVFNIDGTRGYNLEATDQFNYAKIITNGPFTSSDMWHTVYTGFKVNWEEWIGLPGADTIFYDANEPLNGLNKNASNYSLVNGYAIVAIMDFECEDNDGGLTEYRYISPDFTIYDFCEDGRDKPAWECRIQIMDETGTTDFNKNIKTNADCMVRATYRPSVYVAGKDYYAVIRMDDINGNENTIRELSSVETANPLFNTPSPVSELKPISGETRSKITDTGSEIRVECLTDHTKIVNGKCYRVSSHLWVEGIGNGDEPITEAPSGSSDITYAGLKEPKTVAP